MRSPTLLTKTRETARKLLALQLLIFGLLSSCVTSSEQSKGKSQASTTELTISAASSMQDVLTEIKQLYQQQYPQIEIAFNFGSSGSLQHQIEQGAPIDIFISAAPMQMDNLEAKKLLISESRTNLVSNQMVLVVAKNKQGVANFQDLTKKSVEQIALGEPSSVPAGQYAQEILTSLNLTDKIEPKSVYGKNVRQVLNYVATGNVDAGIVYRTDVTATAKVKIIATAPDASHSLVIYPAAIVKDSQYPQAAKTMLQFLATPEAQAVFQQHGFASIDN